MPSIPEPASPLDQLPAALPLEMILGAEPEAPVVVEACRPLGRSLDWELGQLYYLQRGNAAFLNGDVPYLVNNDGVLAARAAQVFFTSIEERFASRDLPPQLCALEFGGGSCLFARGFLLAFRRICQDRSRTYQERLTYAIADHSQLMLDDARRSGVFPPGCRVRLVRADAVEQQFEWLDGGPEIERFDAVFLNYLLDCLPATIVRRNAGALEQLYVQTELAPARPAPGEPVASRLRIAAFAAGDADRSELIDLYPLFRLRCRYQRASEEELPYFEALSPLLEGGKPVLHSYAAIGCLAACLTRLQPGGFVLFSDYGLGQRDTSQQDEATRLMHQHFGSSTAIGLNFDELKDWVCRFGHGSWAQPAADDESLVVRLAAIGSGQGTVDQFCRLFEREELERARSPRRRAREHRDSGALQLALDHYRAAIRLEPDNWGLIAETAAFCQALHDHTMALNLARAALELNPIDPELWNTLGDSLYSLGKKDEAHRAFEWALRLSPASVRSRYNLVYTLSQKGDFRRALALIAEAIEADVAGEYTDRLLSRQSEIVKAIKQRERRKAESMADRYIWE